MKQILLPFYRCCLLAALLIGLHACKQEMPAEGFIKTKDGNELYYQVLGGGEPILVLHGGPTLDHSYLRPHLDFLSKKYKLIYFDQRAAGRSSYALDSTNMSLKTLAEDIEWIRKKLKLGKIHLLAHSFGSVMAQEYASNFSTQLRSLILVSANGPNNSFTQAESVELASRMDGDFKRKRAGFLNSERAKSQDPVFMEEFMKFSFTLQFYDESKMDQLNISLPKDLFQRREKLFFLQNDLKNYNYERELRNLRIPALLIYGEYDPAAKISGPALNSLLHSSDFTLIPECGHFPFIEKPGEFEKIVLSFLEKL